MTAQHTSAVAPGGRVRPAAIVTHSTVIGRLTLAATDSALVYCAFDTPEAVAARTGCTLPSSPAPAHGASAVLEAARSQLDAYLAGRRRDFTLPLDLSMASDFTRDVTTRLNLIAPYGSTVTYGALAGALGRPRAARAVGRALGANPLCVVLPCHRAVGSSGRLTGYAGGLEAKEFLLGLERAG